MRCPSCRQAVKPETAWKSANGRFYCSEFCADSETVTPVRHQAEQKHQIDRQYRERLERLLPLRRAMQATSSSTSTRVAG
jgi:Prokaryotic metallothionein